jgi:hypothetical protein
MNVRNPSKPRAAQLVDLRLGRKLRVKVGADTKRKVCPGYLLAAGASCTR